MFINDDSRKNEEYAEIYQVVHMYYDLNMNQSEIAEKLYMSRAKVSRMITQARELGIVEIKVHPIIGRNSKLEDRLCRTYGLRSAVVINTYNERIELMEEMLLEFAARYVEEILKDGSVLGITNGSVVSGVLDKMSFDPQYQMQIIQLMGSTTNALSSQGTVTVLDRIAKHNANVNTRLLSAPLYVNDLYLKEVLMQEADTHAVLQQMNQCTIALTDVSPLEKGAQYQISWHGQMSPHHLEELNERKAVGCICAQYFNINGIKVTSEWNAKIIAMNIHDFARIDTRIGVAQGLDKLKPLIGAMRGKLINVLVTDSNTASDLIHISEQNRKKS